MTELPVRAYSDRLSYQPGDPVSLSIDAVGTSVDVSMIRMLNADNDNTDLDQPVDWAGAGTYPVSRQQTCVGSFLIGPTTSDAPKTADAVTLGAFLWSADAGVPGEHTIVAVTGESGRQVRLSLRERHLVLTSARYGVSDWEIVSDRTLIDSTWYLLAGTAEGTEASVFILPLDPLYDQESVTTSTIAASTFDLRGEGSVAGHSPHNLTAVAGAWRGIADNLTDAKIEAPFAAAAAADVSTLRILLEETGVVSDMFGSALVAAWDLALDDSIGRDAVTPLVAGQEPGTLVNVPTRGVTGRRFTGDVLNYALALDQYAAIHFHSTDLFDAGWDVAVTAELPADLPSGVYGIVVTNDHGADTVPITVVPRPEDPRKNIVVVLPTFSYLAYANEALFGGGNFEGWTDKPVVVSDVDRAHLGDPSFGLSMYDTHPDGSGVCFSSARRHIVNMRRGYRMWLLDAYRAMSAEMYLIEWLARRGLDVDVITDLEVDERGADYLSNYAVLISGSHPEYTSAAMLDALTEYRDHGGSLVYLGGNGWYWVTGVYSNDPLTVEIRRGHSGVLAWMSYPGEVNLTSTGEPGGLWKYRGRPPQKLVGIGMAAEGWGQSEPYHRSGHAKDPEFAFVFDGVEEDPFGAYGYVMGGAAGDEIDRVDHALGTPHHATVLASSRNHTNYYQRVPEEVGVPLYDQQGGQNDPEVHSDVVYFRTPGGGEVFAAGSIAWSGALLWNGTDNGISRMTENVIRAFVARRSTNSATTAPTASRQTVT